jgi:hypothetical protein
MDSAFIKTFCWLGAVLGWFALAAQYYIYLSSGVASAGETTIRYFSYFTIDSNGLAALAFTSLLLAPGSRLGRFFGHHSTLTAITVYMIVVGLVYNVILRSLWDPQGLQWIVDELLHSVLPAVLVLHWLMIVAPERLQWKSILVWMLFPAVYCILIMLRGSGSGFYPYPFLDPDTLGYQKVNYNIGAMMALFFILAFLLVGVSKILRNRVLAKH